MNVFELFAKVSVNKSQAVNDIRAIETAGKQSSVKMGADFKKLGDNVGKWIKRGAVVAAGAVAALGATSLKNFATMDTKMREVFTLMPGLSEKAKEQMTADVKEISREIGVLPNETIPALYQAISAGVPPDNVFEFMEIAGKAAKAGVTDLEISVDALSSVVNAYGSDVISATEASDAMFTAVRLGKTTFDELGRYLFQVTPVAAAVGVSFDQVAAGMAQITSMGTPTSVAATQMRQMFIELSKSGGELANTFEDLSGRTFQDFMDEGNDLADVLALMQEYADENNISLMDMFSSVEGGMAALNLGGESIDSFRDKLGQMADKADATEVAFAEMTDGIQFRLDQLAAWWQTVQINIGGEMQAGLEDLLSWVEANQDKIEQGLVKMFQGLISALEWIVEHQATIKTALTVIAVGLAAIFAATHPLVASLALLSAGLIYLVSRHEDAARAAEEHAKVLAQLENEAAGMAEAIKKTDDALRSMREGAELVNEAIRNEADDIRGTKQALFDLAGVIVDLQAKLVALEESLNDALGVDYRDSEWKGVFDQLNADLTNAVQDARDEGDDWEASAVANINAVLNAYSLAYPELDEYLSTYTISLEDVAAATTTSVDDQIAAYGRLQDEIAAYRAWSEANQAAIAASQISAFEKVKTALVGMVGPISSVANSIRDAYRGYTEDLPEAEATLASLAEVTGDLTEEQEEMRDSALEVRDSVTGSWAALAAGVASSMNSFLNSVSEMVRSNRELKESHKETLSDITADHKAAYADLSKQRLADLADLNVSLQAGTVTQDEYAAEKLRIQKQYNSDVATLDQARLDAIDDENQAYEDSKQTIWEILKEMGRNLLVAIREELTLQGAKYAVLAAIAAINPLTWAAAGVYALQSGIAFAGAAGLALAGFAKGGIATQATMGVVGEAGVSEGVIPLTARNLSAIGRGIASASGFSREPLGAAGIPGLSGGMSVSLGDTPSPEVGGVVGSGGGVVQGGGETNVSIVFENPVVRDDSDIDKIVEGIESSFEQTRRGLGYAGAT